MPNSKAMNLFDAIIIYLACGAPFGVYYFVNQRNRQNRVFFKPVLILLFWFPFAFGLLQKYVTKKLPESVLFKNEILKEQELVETKKDLEQIFIKNNFGISIFEIKEILERYVGLTNALENQADSDEADTHFFEIAGAENSQLASKCHQRRNRKLLSYHQTLAGQDFLKLVDKFVSRFPLNEEIGKISRKLVNLLNDEITGKSLTMIFDGRKQSRTEISVQKPEKELWIHDLPQPQTAKTLRISMNPASAKINLPIKD